MPTATFVTTHGSFTASLMPDHAPKTVENFMGLAQGSKEWTDPRDGVQKAEPLYPGTVFHRVIDGFMIQGGGPYRDGNRRTGVSVRRRMPTRRPYVQSGRPTGDGERGPRNERKPVLRDGGRNALARMDDTRSSVRSPRDTTWSRRSRSSLRAPRIRPVDDVRDPAHRYQPLGPRQPTVLRS